jgi:putative DNA-invertase from lambdoid prophage Rac
MTSRKTSKQRRIDEALQRLEEDDTLIVTELSRLERNTAEIIALVNELVKRGIRLIALKQHIDLSTGQHDMSSKSIPILLCKMAEKTSHSPVSAYEPWRKPIFQEAHSPFIYADVSSFTLA